MSTKMTPRDLITLGLLVAMSVFLYADQRIMSAILPELSAEYGINVQTLGLIGSAFTLVGALVSIFFGFFTDRVSRKKLLIVTVVIGEIPCLLTGLEFFTPTVEWFTVLRILTGIGIGGIYPISFSLISDYFKEEHRAKASAWLGLAWAIGMMAGPGFAGFLTGEYGWRIAFLIAAIPNFPLVLFFAFYARDPERGRSEAALAKLIEQGIAYKQTISLKDFAVIFKNKTNIFTFLQGIPGTIPWGILGFWLILFFEEMRAMPKESATTVFLLLGVFTTIGAVFFAVIGDKLYQKRPSYVPIMCGIGVLLGTIPTLILINLDMTNPTGGDLYLLYSLSALAGFLVSVPSANVKSILMNVNRPEHRGSVFAVFNITDNLGQGFGPAIGGMLVASSGYLFSMNFAAMWWILCGLLFFFVAFTLEKDRTAMQDLMKERAREMSREQI